MKKSVIIIVAVVAAVVIWCITSYNGLVSKEENVDSQWANVESSYQRRSDLIPNLVETVKGYASHEKETLQGVIEARSKATSTQINAGDLTSENIQQFQAAQDQLSNALSKLMVVVERYPDLKANENFLQLQSQLEGTENRINVERNKYNEVAKSFNANIRKFPKNIIANMFGFEKKAYFEAQEGAKTAPQVKF